MKTTKKAVSAEAIVSSEATAESVPGMVSVQPLRRFMDGDVFRTPQDEAFTVSRQRAADLKANDLVALVGDAPDNKMSPQPDTKG
ncbi:hypothetical protein [Klebsiella oxytoca]|uniref:hypothetical protein n=1 Tax=Klebsiella oxytoca TaxID=571 RepID=UPI001159A62D|nr:hypothetical protein [Klebsiella oxytoca]